MKALHSLTNSCDFADLKFRLAEMRSTYHFGALSMGYVSFWRPYTGKKPLLSTKAREVFLLNASRVCTPLKKGGATVGCLPFGYDDSIIVFKEVLA